MSATKHIQRNVPRPGPGKPDSRGSRGSRPRHDIQPPRVKRRLRKPCKSQGKELGINPTTTRSIHSFLGIEEEVHTCSDQRSNFLETSSPWARNSRPDLGASRSTWTALEMIRGAKQSVGLSTEPHCHESGAREIPRTLPSDPPRFLVEFEHGPLTECPFSTGTAPTPARDRDIQEPAHLLHLGNSYSEREERPMAA